MFDTHAHLDDPQFDLDRDAVVERARAAGLTSIICIGTSAATSRKALDIAERYPDVYAAVGIHPNSCAEIEPGDWERIVAMADHPRVVALGETGLDRYWDYAPLDLQQDYFERHLRLGQARDLPVAIHCRDADADLMPMLRTAAARGPLRAILHAFSGDTAMAAECVSLGLYISFAGNSTYTNKKFQSLRAVVPTVPADRILTETDCPYLTPEPFRGKQRRNEPALVVHTAAALAALRGIDPAEFALRTAANARRVFKL